VYTCQWLLPRLGEGKSGVCVAVEICGGCTRVNTCSNH